MNYHIAIDIGGTQLRVACYPIESLTPQIILRTPTKDPQSTPFHRLVELINSIWPDDNSVLSIGIAAPGPIDTRKGIVIEAPNIPNWVDFPLCECLEDRFDTPAVIGNDANLAALGEWKYGAGRGHHNMIYLTVSTGIGGGVIVDDRLLLGDRGLAAELGHVTVVIDGPLCSCGQHGHLEAVAAGPAIARWVEDQLAQGVVSSLAGNLPVTAKAVAQAAQQGDELACQAMDRAGYFIGLVLASYLHIFNPTAIVIGGGVSRSGELILKPIRKSIMNHVMNPHYLEFLRIETATNGDEAGLLGALALARGFKAE